MTPDSRIDRYVFTDNAPLPFHLQPSLNSFVSWLDHQGDACKRDRQRIEEAIDERHSRIQALENEIKRLKAVQETLITTEKSIFVKRNRYRGTLSPVRRTPPEIIARIISLAILRHGMTVGPQDRKCFQNLRAVCRSWRQTSFSTPSLWRRVGLVSGDFPFSQHQIVHPHQTERLGRSLSSWFSRGGQDSPLNLYLIYVSVEHATFAIELMRNLQLNITSATVAIDSNRSHDGGYYGLKFLELTPTDTNRALPLKNLDVVFGFPANYRRTNPRERVELTHHWPDLSTISLVCNDDTCPTSLTHKTLSTLTLGSTHLSADDVEFIVAGLPQLKSLNLSGCTPLQMEQEDALNAAHPCIHSALQKLKIRDGIPQAFISRLTCPSLEELVVFGIKHKDVDREVELGFLQSFIKRCSVSNEFSFYGKGHQAP
ncbi:hypothetical protein BKA70DRAFT_1450272 [Coprinopsis sp. MPI-PUGE-AT-0042]|nr:hypothetical protein BKA70DRAFT_1450272 [Coprinopsis sp. MPI-PUGE-AT-0042]